MELPTVSEKDKLILNIFINEVVKNDNFITRLHFLNEPKKHPGVKGNIIWALRSLRE